MNIFAAKNLVPLFSVVVGGGALELILLWSDQVNDMSKKSYKIVFLVHPASHFLFTKFAIHSSLIPANSQLTIVT